MRMIDLIDGCPEPANHTNDCLDLNRSTRPPGRGSVAQRGREERGEEKDRVWYRWEECYAIDFVVLEGKYRVGDLGR